MALVSRLPYYYYSTFADIGSGSDMEMLSSIFSLFTRGPLEPHYTKTKKKAKYFSEICSLLPLRYLIQLRIVIKWITLTKLSALKIR